jgi:hypothetical protein
MKWVVLATALTGLPIDWASAQQSQPPQQGPRPSYVDIIRQGYSLSKAEAEKLEAGIAGNPDDLPARTKLLGYYFRGARREASEDRIAARRRHILLLIEYHPGSETAGLSQVTIDPFGDALADKVGYELASKLWIEQAQRHGRDVAVLGNAARFFVLHDKAQAESLFKRAQQVEPHNPWWSAHLGYLYAIGILGLDGMNENGLPASHSPAEAKGEFARRAQEALEKSGDPATVGAAGSILGKYGLLLEVGSRETGRPFAVDYAPLADALLMRAQRLDPANRRWPDELEQFRKWRRELEQKK